MRNDTNGCTVNFFALHHVINTGGAIHGALPPVVGF
jgi:hypothetical protein